jgi:hypothetical protein
MKSTGENFSVAIFNNPTTLVILGSIAFATITNSYSLGKNLKKESVYQ